MLQVASLASLASAPLVCTLGCEQLNAKGKNYRPHSRLPHGVGVGSPLSLSFFPRLPCSNLPHGVGVGVGSLPSLSFFPRLPSSSRVSPSSRDSLARASLMASALARRRVSPLPETPWLEPPSWRRRWLAAESLSLLEIPSQELVYVNMQLTRPDLAGGAYSTARVRPM